MTIEIWNRICERMRWLDSTLLREIDPPIRALIINNQELSKENQELLKENKELQELLKGSQKLKGMI
jgi:hypothetical protein